MTELTVPAAKALDRRRPRLLRLPDRIIGREIGLPYEVMRAMFWR
jgi:hypothetical protein